MDDSTKSILTTVGIVGGIFALMGGVYGYYYSELTPEQKRQYWIDIKKRSRRGTRKNSRK